MFTTANKANVALKIAVTGVAGSGKTYSSLLLARGLIGSKGRIAVIDTENESASLYNNLTPFDVCNIKPKSYGQGAVATSAFWWRDFMDAITDATLAKYDVLIIDSASHIWQGTLDYKNRLDSTGGNSFANWGAVGTTFNSVQNAILQAPIPVICCFRSKTEYAMEKDDAGKVVVRKVGLAPITRDGADYEFTTVFDIDSNHVATVSKSRCSAFNNTWREQITENTGKTFKDWLASN